MERTERIARGSASRARAEGMALCSLRSTGRGKVDERILRFGVVDALRIVS